MVQISLPREILQLVVDQVRDFKTLTSLLVTSRAFHQEAERALYQKLELDDSTKSQPTLHMLIRRIREAPHILHHVRELCIMAWDHHSLPDSPLSVPLHLMNNLVVLTVVDRWDMRDPPSARMLRRCSFQLRHLTWRVPGNEEEVVSFLGTQSRLRSLDVVYWEEIPAVPIEIIPELRFLTARLEPIRALLPGRNVLGLQWLPNPPTLHLDARTIDPPLQLAFQNLRILDCTSLLHKSTFFESVLPYLTRVVILVMFWFEDTTEDLLHRLPQLRLFILNDKILGSDNRRAFAKRLFGKTPQLVRVDTSMPVGGNGPNNKFERWTREEELERCFSPCRHDLRRWDYVDFEAEDAMDKYLAV